MDSQTRAELVRKLSLIVQRLFDDDPGPAISRLRALVEKHGLHPTQIGASIGGSNQLEDLQRERDEAVMASWRDWNVLVEACRAKGYVGYEQIAKAVNVSLSLVKEWSEIGRVPAVFFSVLAEVPNKRDREKEIRAVMTEAKRRVRAEDKRRAKADRQKAKLNRHAKPEAGPELPSLPLDQATIAAQIVQ